jgi:pimeloyl-ACP methyl ester carboxylesterase
MNSRAERLATRPAGKTACTSIRPIGQYRNLLPALADGYYVIEPDYPGYADSDAKLVYSYAMYVAGYGAPLGWRLALAHPERISAGKRRVAPYFRDGNWISTEKMQRWRHG